MTAARRLLPEAARRGWCPSLARPMPTGDGLLARVHPPLGILSLDQARAVVEGARRFGNGHIDVTARANLQIRGVSEATNAALAALLAGVGLGDRRADGGPQRLTLTSPLAGLDRGEAIDVPALARAIEALGEAIDGLPPKTLVAITGPGVSGDGADLVLRATDHGTVAIALADDDGQSIIVAEPNAAGAVAGILCAFVATGHRRVRDLSLGERETVIQEAEARASIARLPSPRTRGEGRDDPVVGATSPKGDGEGASTEEAHPSKPPHHRFARLAPDKGGSALSPPAGRGGAAAVFASRLEAGVTALGNLTLLILEAPFGRCTGDALDRLVDVASALSAPDIRLTPSRGFVLACRDEAVAPAALQALAEADFLTRSDDPRRAVAACPGAPACASATTPVLADASRLAPVLAPFAARGLTVHVSGCAKGCAHPAPTDLTLVAEGSGYSILIDAAPGDRPVTRLTFEAALERVRRADPAAPLADAFRT